MSSLQFEAHIDISQIRRELAEMEARFQRTTQSASSSGQEMDATFKKIGAAMAGYFTLTAAKGFLDQVIAVRGEFQQLDIALQTMLGNKEQADKLMANVVQLAAKTPFSLTELGQGAKQLLAFKTPAEQIPDTLRRIGDVAAGVSVPVGDLISAYGKVSAKGKMQAEELNQFAERGVPIISELAKVIGTTDDAIYKMAEQGKIGFNELQQAIVNMTNEGGQFANMMEKQAESLTGQVSNLGDAWDRMLNDIGTSSQGMISGGIKGLTSLVENYEEVLKVLGTVVATYGTYKAALAVTSLAQKTMAAEASRLAIISRDAEAANLTALLSAQQKEMIAKKGLTAGTQEYAMAVKAEIAANIEAMQIAAKKAATEATAARERHRQALQEALNSKRLVEQKRYELALAKGGGKEKDIERAKTALLNAEEQRSITVKARKATADQLVIANSRKAAAAKAAETITTQVSTAANVTNAGSTNLLTAAKMRLVGAMKGVKAAFMANPYGLALTAITALAGGIIALMPKAEKTADIIERLDEATRRYAENTGKIESLSREYETLKEKTGRTTEENERLNAVMNLLAESVPDAVTEFDQYGRALEISTEKVKGFTDAQKKALEIDVTDQLRNAEKELAGLDAELKKLEPIFQEGKKIKVYQNFDAVTGAKSASFTEEIKASQKEINDAAREANKLYEDRSKLLEKIADAHKVLAGVSSKSEGGEAPPPPVFQNIQSEIVSTRAAIAGLENDLSDLRGGKKQSTNIEKDITDTEAKLKAQQNRLKTLLGDEKNQYEEHLKAKKELYAKYENAKAVLGIAEADKLYPNLLGSYKDYLAQQMELYRNNEEKKRQLAIEFASTGGSNPMQAIGSKDGDIKRINTDPKAVPTIPITMPNPKQLAPMTSSMNRWKKQAEDIEKSLAQDNLGGVGAGLIEGANAMSEMARYAGQMDEELGKALQSTADIVGNVGNVVAGMASGDYLGAAVGAVGVMATVSSLFDDSAAKQAEAARRAENTRQQYELQNRALEYQIELMNTLSGTDRTQAQVDNIELIRAKMAKIDENVSKKKLSMSDGTTDVEYGINGIESLEALLANGEKINTGVFKDIGLTMEKVEGLKHLAPKLKEIGKLGEANIETFNDFGFNITNLDELQNDIDQYKSLQEQIAKTYEEASGTTTDAITDSIVEGFQNGQSAADSLAEHTKDSMKNALIESFKNTYVTAAAANIVTKIGEAMTDGLVTQDEQDAINAATQTAAEAAEKGMKIYTDAYRNMYGEDLFSSDTDSTESGLAGGIRKEMTEETASRLAGLFNVMSLDTRSIRDNITLNLANNVQQLNQMIAIELNTGRTAVATEATVAALNNAITELRSIKTNTSNNRRGEG